MDKKIIKIKKALFRSLMDNDPDFYKSENTVYAENAFLINSVLAWYLRDRPELNSHDVSSFMGLLEKHLNKELIISWDEDNLRISTPADDYDESIAEGA